MAAPVRAVSAKSGLQVAEVQAALFLGLFFPPPSALTFVLTGIDWTRAGLATNRDEAAIVERVVRHVVLADVRPHLRRRPETQWIELDQRSIGGAERAIELDDRHVGARARTLVLPLSGDPGALRLQRTRQRLD